MRAMINRGQLGELTNFIQSNRSFSLMMLAQGLQALGNHVYYFALPWYIYELTQSSKAMGTMNFIQTAAPLVLGLFIGMLIDRTRKKRFLIINSVIFLSAVFTMILLANFDALPLLVAYLLGLVFALCNEGYDVAYRATIPLLVEQKHLPRANSWESVISSFAALAGPTFAGVLVGWYGAINSMLVTAVTAIVVMILFLFMKTPEVNAFERGSVQSVREFWQEFMGGFHFFKENRKILLVCLLALVMNFGHGGALSMIVFHAAHYMNLAADQTALIFTLAAVGTLVGGMFGARVKEWLGTGMVTIWFGILCGLAISVLGLSKSAVMFGAFYAVVMFSRIVINIAFTSTLQTLAPAEKLGTIFSTVSLLAGATFPLGIFVMSFSAAYVSTMVLYMICGMLLVLAMGAAYFTDIRTLK